ncbi:MAG TPA: hypothetical protein VL119_10390 [Acidimicrobiia bacterium]|nr:hypothetical protein [Acidimicrobiia bacterium]
MNRWWPGLLWIVGCSDPSYTVVHVEVSSQAGLTVESYDVRVAEFEHSLPPTKSFDLVVPSDTVGEPTAIVVAAMDHGTQVAYGAATLTPKSGATTDAIITLASSACPTSCTQGETVCSGEATITCELGSNGCYDWSQPVACPSTAPFCSNGACAAACSNDCSQIGATDCDGAAVRTCQASQTDTCLHWSVPVACDAPPDPTCISSTMLRTWGAGTCSNGACSYPPTDTTCPAPANGTATCTTDQCGYTCDAGYMDDGQGDCVAAGTCTVTTCGSDADCGDASCGPCLDNICLGLFGGT